MREIEIKARVGDKKKLLDDCTKLNITLSEPLKQHDVVYYMEGTKHNASGSIWLRIRTENETTTILTLKKQHRGGLDSIEHETIVSDADETEQIIKQLGYSLYSDLTKIRQKAKIEDIEICVDEVSDLGCFIEAEKLVDLSADGKQVEDELWALFEQLNVSRDDQVLVGYDVLHRAKMQEIAADK